MNSLKIGQTTMNFFVAFEIVELALICIVACVSMAEWSWHGRVLHELHKLHMPTNQFMCMSVPKVCVLWDYI